MHLSANFLRWFEGMIEASRTRKNEAEITSDFENLRNGLIISLSPLGSVCGIHHLDFWLNQESSCFEVIRSDHTAGGRTAFARTGPCLLYETRHAAQ